MGGQEMIPAGWTITRQDQAPFKFITIRAPNGYAARVASHDRNPENVLYMLADALLKGTDAEPASKSCMTCAHDRPGDGCAAASCDSDYSGWQPVNYDAPGVTACGHQPPAAKTTHGQDAAP